MTEVMLLVVFIWLGYVLLTLMAMSLPCFVAMFLVYGYYKITEGNKHDN